MSGDPTWGLDPKVEKHWFRDYYKIVSRVMECYSCGSRLE